MGRIQINRTLFKVKSGIYEIDDGREKNDLAPNNLSMYTPVMLALGIGHWGKIHQSLVPLGKRQKSVSRLSEESNCTCHHHSSGDIVSIERIIICSTVNASTLIDWLFVSSSHDFKNDFSSLLRLVGPTSPRNDLDASESFWSINECF